MPTQIVNRQIADAAITYNKIQNVTTARLLGRASAGSGVLEEIILGANLSFTGTTLNAVNSGGTVTTVSIVSANGFSGTILNPTTTPAITLTTTITGLLKGNGTAITAAVLNTDYLDTTYTGFDTRYLRLTGGSLSGNVNFTAGTLTLFADPTSAMHAATKQYVDSVAISLSWKNAVRVGTLVAGTLTTSFANGSVVDGITLVTGDRILIKNQTTQTENGIYIVQSTGTPIRSSDTSSAIQLDSATVMIEYGTQANSQWTETGTITTIGISNVVFAQIGGSGAYTNGTGITLTGNVFALDTTYTNSLYVPVGRNLTINGSTQTLSADRIFTITTTGTTGRIVVTGGAGLAPTIDLASGIVTSGSGFNTFTVDTYGRVTAASTTAYLTGNQSITLSGDVTGTGTTAITTSILNTVVTGKTLTGFSAVTGSVIATDTVLTAINKLSGNEALWLAISKVIFNETLGIITTAPNNTTTAFSLAATPASPNASKVAIFINGQKQKPVTDYTISGSTVTFIIPPLTGDVLDANYIQA